MKISLIQSQSEKGKVAENIQHHVKLIEKAIESNPDLIIFPELSVTGYEPELAKELATGMNDERFHPFQALSDKYDVVIGVGMPIHATDGINIGMILFQPKNDRLLYTKNILHEDEWPFFVSGECQPLLNIKGKKIALGICYETLQKEHVLKAVERKADLYIASVAKPERGIEKAEKFYPDIASEYNMPVLMANCVGYHDNFLNVGQSAVWDSHGDKLAQLDEKNEGILIYETERSQVDTLQVQTIK